MRSDKSDGFSNVLPELTRHGARMEPSLERRRDEPCLKASGEETRSHSTSSVANPATPVLRAWAYLTGMKFTEGIGAIEALSSCQAVDADDDGVALLRAASLVLQDDVESAVAVIRARPRLGAMGHPAGSLIMRIGHWKARDLDAFAALSQPIAAVPARRREALVMLLNLSMEAAVEAEQLHLGTARRLASEALALSGRLFGADFSGSRLAASVKARLLYEQGEVDEADRLIRDRLVLTGAQGGVEAALTAYLVGARIAAARGQAPFAVLLLREAEELGQERRWPRLVAASLAERVRMLLETGRHTDALACLRRLAKTAKGTVEAENKDFVVRQFAIARARVELADGPDDSTADSLRLIVADCRGRGELLLAVELQVLLASVLQKLGRDDEARSEMGEAIADGARTGLYRTLIDGGDPAQRLLSAIDSQALGDPTSLGKLRPYARSLLAGFPDRRPQPMPARSRHRSGESLSPRERHIIALISHGLSNKRIAKELGIAPETVKSHAKHILLKLAAQTRVEAVSRALSLGIL